MKLTIYDWERAPQKVKKWKPFHACLLGAWMVNMWYMGITLANPFNMFVLVFFLGWHYIVAHQFIPRKEVEFPGYFVRKLRQHLIRFWPQKFS